MRFKEKLEELVRSSIRYKHESGVGTGTFQEAVKASVNTINRTGRSSGF